MRLRVLGCSGGIGGRHLRTTSFLLEESVLIDAGTGVGDLPLAELARIDHVFVTHSHLDHVTSIPFLVDTVCTIRSAPITVHATAATIAILRAHLFNDLIWPDFNRIPSGEAPYLRYQEIALGKASAAAGCQVTPLPAVHTVPAVGFQLDSGRASVVFTGDTGPNAALWDAVNRIRNLKALIIETAFSNGERDLAELSKHLCPSMLAAELANLEARPEIWITHLKPGEIDLTMQEVAQAAGAFRPRMLQNGQVIEF
jgi:ribonuclease BN (tRNA processing enzyme)